jgi:hypothetical protein
MDVCHAYRPSGQPAGRPGDVTPTGTGYWMGGPLPRILKWGES